MIAHPPPTGIDAILPYPLEQMPCPECAGPWPGVVARDAKRIGKCPRCNGARIVFRPLVTPSFTPEGTP